jgi:hypothetical protein
VPVGAAAHFFGCVYFASKTTPVVKRHAAASRRGTQTILMPAGSAPAGTLIFLDVPHGAARKQF